MQCEDPVAFRDAVAVDAALRQNGRARGMRPGEYMYRSYQPLGEVDFEARAGGRRCHLRMSAMVFVAPELQEPVWWLTKDGDRTRLRMYERHYSAYRYRDGRKGRLFVGPGEKTVLRTRRRDAFFVWRNFSEASGQTGVNCAVFRNESAHRSSGLIRQADHVAYHVWPDARHYIYLGPHAVASPIAGVERRPSLTRCADFSESDQWAASRNTDLNVKHC